MRFFKVFFKVNYQKIINNFQSETINDLNKEIIMTQEYLQSLFIERDDLKSIRFKEQGGSYGC